MVVGRIVGLDAERVELELEAQLDLQAARVRSELTHSPATCLAEGHRAVP